MATYELAGGEQTSTSPTRRSRAQGVLGAAPAGVQALNRHLPEIAALIDSRHLVTARDATDRGHSGRGSGKTTVGLHRLAYLAFTSCETARAHGPSVSTGALAAYIGEVPVAGHPGV